MITIKNLRKEKPSEPWDFRVDRTCPLGNPYIMNNESMRSSVCDQYETYFYRTIKSNKQPLLKAYLDKLERAYTIYGKLNLFCWCAPKRCHAEIIKEYLEDKLAGE